MVAQRDQMTALVAGIGEAGVAALQQAKVLVVGAGGIGSPVLAYLAAAGVGTLGISDDDVVEESNLQRQVIHQAKHVGQVKSWSAQQSLAALNPAVQVHRLPHLSAANATQICQQFDVVVDATDNFAAKYLLSDTCQDLHLPHVWGTLVGTSFQASVFIPPLSLRDIYPTVPAPGTTLTSATAGVLGPVCGQLGSILATETIKVLTNLGRALVGKLLVVDAAGAKWNVIDFSGASPTSSAERDIR